MILFSLLIEKLNSWHLGGSLYPAGSRYASMAVHYTLREAATRLHPHFMQRQTLLLVDSSLLLECFSISQTTNN
ncbi:hypothetical protein CBP16_21015 [Fischerella thermalis WC217]|nr:hypothetical protein CBP16_21015 [Fischerella thermalis WC217]